AATARIGVLETGYGQIQVLQTDIASINTLLAGNVSAGSTQTIVLNANNTTIANALIKSAMIESINADKINAGSINTDNVTIKSSSGGIQIADNTMQFKDKNNNVRIQIGQDTQDNFNFIVRAEDGTTTLIDGTGVKENAIADNLIKTRMLQDNSVKGSKIDWDDFFTTINADGTHTLNSSKVKLNSNNQTLDVAFNSLTTTVNNIEVGARNLLKQSDCGCYSDIVNFGNIAFKKNQKYILNMGNIVFTSTLLAIVDTSKNTSTDTGDGFIQKIKNWTTVYGLISFTSLVEGNYSLRFWGTGIHTVYNNSDKKIKLEKGTKATDYTPAPEDVDNKINTCSTSINVQKGKIETLVSTTEQLTTKSNNNKSAITTLNTNYSTLTQTIDNISSTVSSHTSTINDLQTSISNANSSISQLSDSIKLKVATSTYNADKEGILASISNNSSAITQLNNSIKLKVESTDVTNAINNVIIGTRNLLKQSESGGDADHVIFFNIDLLPNTKYVLSMNGIAFTSTELTIKENANNTTVLTLKSWTKVYGNIAFTTPSTIDSTKKYNLNYWGAGIRAVYNNSHKKIKLEKGTKATDYTPAPEDITAYTDTKVSSVEQQITANAITTKISTAINNGTSSINTTYFTQDNTGLTIKNGGIKVLNNANTQIFGVGTDGYLDMRGVITQYNANGRKSVEIKNNAIKIYNYKISSNDLVGGLANVNDFTNKSSSSGIAVYGTQNHTLHIGMSRSDSITRYISCVDMGDGDTDRRIDVQMETYFRGWGATFCNNDFTMRGFIKADAGAETGLCIIGANSVHLGYGSSSSNYSPGIDISKDGITIWGNLTVVGKINGKTI
ncbi:MAG: hypothetical protein SOV35_01860, partial [Clostridium sp.]|nr:hypothetical protein [Clostridium sp.]